MDKEEIQNEESAKAFSPLKKELFLLKHLGSNYLQFIIQSNAQYTKEWESLAQDILKYFECKRCGDCCKRIPVELDDKEVARLCKVLKINFEEFEREYLDPTSMGIYLKLPCPFLKENLCIEYKYRPDTCRLYPFRPDMSIATCPLGLEIIDKLGKSKVTKIVIPKNIPDEIKNKIPPELLMSEEEAPKDFIILQKKFQDIVGREIGGKRPPLLSGSEPKISVLSLPVKVLKPFLEKLKEERDTIK